MFAAVQAIAVLTIFPNLKSKIMYQHKPRPRITDDICVKHNRRLRDYEVANGCIRCEQERREAERAENRKTIINVLPPQPPPYVNS